MTTRALTLYEEILLLALDDDEGTIPLESMFRNAMGGAILAELARAWGIRRETREGMREAMDLLMDAVEDDPTSAMAWAGLAYGYGELGHSAFPEEGAYVRSKAAADRAIDLDPNLAEAHLAVGMYQLYYEWDFAAAEALDVLEHGTLPIGEEA